MNCIVCGKSDLEVGKSDVEITLSKCPICFKLVCQDCAKREYGRIFCTQRCADMFFFGDDDE